MPLPRPKRAAFSAGPKPASKEKPDAAIRSDAAIHNDALVLPGLPDDALCLPARVPLAVRRRNATALPRPLPPDDAHPWPLALASFRTTECHRLDVHHVSGKDGRRAGIDLAGMRAE